MAMSHAFALSRLRAGCTGNAPPRSENPPLMLIPPSGIVHTAIRTCAALLVHCARITGRVNSPDRHSRRQP